VIRIVPFDVEIGKGTFNDDVSDSEDQVNVQLRVTYQWEKVSVKTEILEYILRTWRKKKDISPKTRIANDD
jgi:hypothetical protein